MWFSSLFWGWEPMTTSPSSAQVTQLLRSWSAGDQAALEKLTPLIYSELHRLARGYMRQEREGHILRTTALINEAFHPHGGIGMEPGPGVAPGELSPAAGRVKANSE